MNYWDDVGFAYQRPPGLINAPIRRDTRRKQLAEEQARRTYQGLLERDLIGIQQFSPFFGLNTRDPDAIPIAPMDVLPAGAGAKALGLLSTIPVGMIGQLAYHGGPHKWLPEAGRPLGRPRLDKVGEGEGAQAYGHGFYVAEDPTVAGTYQAKVSAMHGTEKATIDGRPVNWDDPVETAAFELERHKGNREAAADFFERTFKPSTVPEILRSGQKLPEVKLPGSLYKMDVPDDDVAKMLDYDAPLSEQPGILKTLRGISTDPLHSTGLDRQVRGMLDTKTGGEVLEHIQDVLYRGYLGAKKKGGKDMYYQPEALMKAKKDASAYLAKLGIPGLKYLDQGSRTAGVGTRNMVIWDEDLLKRIKVLERDGVKPEIVPGVPRGDEMVVTHNLTPDNLAHAERMGGLPMPSLGVAKTGRPIEGYGDIVLVGDKEMAKSSARNPVAPADSYTVRYPKILQDINKKSEADALELFTAPIREIDPKLADEVLSKPWRLFDDLDELRHYWPSKALFLKDIGRENVLRRALSKRYGKDDDHTIDSLLTDEIREAGFIEDWYDYSDKLVDRLRQSGVRIDERIFKGFTPAGNRRYAAHTLDNVMKEMRWEARDAYHGASMYGMGAIRARIAPRFKNLKAVVEARGRLVGDDEFKKAKEEIENAFIELSEKLGKHRKATSEFGMLDVVAEDLIDYARRGRRGLDDFYDDVPDALLKEMDELVTAIKKMPTEYFEIKPNRIMQVDEFSGALVPDDVSEDVIARLNRMGINRIEKYSKPSMTSEEQALFPFSDLNVGSGKSKALDKFQDVMFSAAPLGLIGLEEDREGLLR